MSDQPDLFGEGERRKSEGIERIWNNNAVWIERGVRLADSHLPHGEVMGEDIRRLPGLGSPSVPQAYGALVQACKRAGVIRPTGRFRKAKHANNHAHKYEIYYRPGYPNPF